MKTLKEERIIFTLDGRDYYVDILYKRVRNYVLRAKRGDEDSFSFTCPPHTSQRRAKEVLALLMRRNLKNRERRKRLATSVNEGETYVLGERKALGLTREQESDYLKGIGLPLIRERVAHYEALMGIEKPYKVRVKDMVSCFGSNSRKTHSLSFATSIFHYPLEVIDSVVVHELAHDSVFNHSGSFYKLVYKYCPDYDRLTKRLKRKQYAREDNQPQEP